MENVLHLPWTKTAVHREGSRMICARQSDLVWPFLLGQAKTSGRVLRHCYLGSLQSSVKPGERLCAFCVFKPVRWQHAVLGPPCEFLLL